MSLEFFRLDVDESTNAQDLASMDLLNLFNDASAAVPSRDQQIFSAASRGNYNRFVQLYNDGSNITTLHNGFNCLHTAAKKNHLQIVQFILDQHPNLLSSSTNDGRTSSMIAAFEGNLDILKLLTAAATTVEVDPLGNNVLHYASWGGKLDCIKFCVEDRQMNPLEPNREGMSSVQFTSAGNHVDCLLFLEQYIQSKDGLNEVTPAISETGLTSLHRACLHGAVDIVVHILEQIQTENKVRFSAYLDQQTIDALPVSLQDRASLDSIRQIYFTQGIYTPSHSGNTALHLSTQNNSTEIVSLLLSHIQDEEKTYPLLFLDETAEGDVQTVVRPKKGIDLQNKYGLTPIHFACIG
jgi:ankyrin repeat protein